MFKDIPLAKPWESTVRKSQQLQQQTRRAASFIFSFASVPPATADGATPAAPASSDGHAPPPPPLPPRKSSCDELLLPSAFDDGTDKDDEDESDDPGGSNLEHTERLLPNGDFYTGQWRGSLPHGTGKYLWTDGCMYEGQWRRGKTTGKGKFSWPSGATYEGEFKCGYMDGTGTYTGALGDTYRGSWAMNLKHGDGMKSYANGDYYEGEWRSGLQDGQGRYTWRNGNEYVGHWRAGIIHGQGTLVWANGNRYEGSWEKGLPKGNGSFHWADGGRYVGNWSSENGSVNLQSKGVYHPPSNASSPTVRDPREAFSMALRECTVCPAENVSILPSQKALNWSGVEADCPQKQAAWRSSKSWAGSPASRTSLDDTATGSTPRVPNGHTNTLRSDSSNGGASFRESNVDTSFDAENSATVGGGDATEASTDAAAGGGGGGPSLEDLAEGRKRFQRMLKSLPKEVKKQGESISKGHKNYELMLNLQLGIRHAVGKNAEPTTFDLKASAFDPKEKIWTRFPPEGTKQTPPHQCSEFRWKDYCPLVFRTLRKLFKVDPAEYMLSICGNDALRELSSPGKSGSFFYLTNDDKYMIKTMKKSEVKVLMRMLPAYYNHVRAYENCLVTRFFSLHCVKLTGAIQRKVRFVIMGNLFCSEHVIHRRFDLKGSSLGRITDKPETEIDETTTLKDLDLNFIFRLHKSWFEEFRRQVDKDCEFLEQEWIMDYSLLVGVHFIESPPPAQDTDDGSCSGTSDVTTDSTGATDPGLSRASMDQPPSDPTSSWGASMKLGSNMPSRVELIERRNDVESPLIGEPTGEFYDVVLYFGIIDILQDYDITKKLEHAYKSFQYDATSISAVDPRLYAKRFRDFVFKVFAEEI